MKREDLQSIGVTQESWSEAVNLEKIIGVVATSAEQVVGFVFCEIETSEILVLALLPEYENLGIGKQLLLNMISDMEERGHQRLWLAASPDDTIRAHGFYRHLGWQTTHQYDGHGDEILEYFTNPN